MASETKFAPGPWEYNDPATFQQPLGKFSDVAVYAAGNAFPWRMAEIQGPDEVTEIATARLIAAAPDMLAALQAFNLKEEWIVSGSADSITIRVPLAVIQQAAAAVSKATL